jgi:hypothetical protein
MIMIRTAIQDLSLEIRDVIGNTVTTIDRVTADTRVSDLIDDVMSRAVVPRNDSEGRAVDYSAIHGTKGEKLTGEELAVEVFAPSDVMVLEPNIEAGCPS